MNKNIVILFLCFASLAMLPVISACESSCFYHEQEFWDNPYVVDHPFEEPHLLGNSWSENYVLYPILEEEFILGHNLGKNFEKSSGDHWRMIKYLVF